MPWPSSIPPDLRKRLDRVRSYRDVETADLWTEIREWLIEHEVEAPERLPEAERFPAVREGH